MKRALCLFMALFMLFSLAGCSKGEGLLSRFKKDEEPTEYLILPYSRENGVNPFTATSLLNSTLMPLLYAGLYSIDAQYNPTPDIAESIQYDGSRKVTVTIDKERLFSDGHPIKGVDVVNSFRAAKKSTYYSSALTTIETCVVSEDDPYTVIFTTEIANSYVASLLTFPIVRSNTATDSSSVPSGAGPYVYTATTEGGELTPNKYYKEDYEYAMDKVTLTNVTDSANLNLGLVIGNVDAVFDDLSSGESQRLAARSAHVDLNNLVYLNISDRGVFSRPKMRQAIAALIDRDDLVNGGFEGYGSATKVPFNSQWYALGDYEPTFMTEKEAKEYLKKALGTYVVNIFVCTDNNFKVKLADSLKTQLNNAGINAEVRANSYEIYSSGIENNYADIWISEYKMTNDMNIGALITDEALSATYFSMVAGNTTVEEFCNAFYESVPFIPVCIRYGVTAYSKTMEGGVQPLPNNPFANLNEWSVGEES